MAGPDPREAAARLAAGIPAIGRRRPRSRCATTGTRPTSSADRCGTRCCWGANLRTGTSPPTPDRRGSSSCSPAPCTRTGSGPSPCGGTAWCSRSRPSGSSTTTRTTGGPTGWSSETTSRPTSRAATSPSTRWPGAARPSATTEVATRSWSTRSAACATSGPAPCAPSGTRWRALHEDALRMVRAVRLAATHDLSIEAGDARRDRGERRAGRPPVRRARRRRAVAAAGGATPVGRAARSRPTRACWPSSSRSSRPSAASRRTRCRARTCGTTRSGPWTRRRAERPVVRLAALLHDVGKPATLADGRFHHHDAVGAEQAAAILRRLRFPKATVEDVAHLVRHHMFTVEADPSGPAVRRFIRRIGRDHVDALFELRRADDIGSGLAPDDPATRRVPGPGRAPSSRRGPALDRGALAVDGGDLIRDLGLEPGPRLGRVLDALLERVIGDPAPQRPGHPDAARTGHACRHAG